MANDRLKFAIGRLERAAARVERLVAETPSTSRTDADPLLARRHEQLREQVHSAISRIDALIASAER